MRSGLPAFVVLLTLAIAGNGFAQTVTVPTANVEAQEHQGVKADVMEAKAEIKMSAATRQQIQALRLALRAKLAAMRH